MALPQVVLSTRVNKTSADGKVFITGDHNEVVMSMTKEAKIAALTTQVQKMFQRLTALERKGTYRVLAIRLTKLHLFFYICKGRRRKQMLVNFSL